MRVSGPRIARLMNKLPRLDFALWLLTGTAVGALAGVVLS